MYVCLVKDLYYVFDNLSVLSIYSEVLGLVISMTCIEKKCLTQTPAQKSRVSYLRKRE